MRQHRPCPAVEFCHDHHSWPIPVKFQFPTHHISVDWNVTALDLDRPETQRPSRFPNWAQLVCRDFHYPECLGQGRLGQGISREILFPIVQSPGTALFGQPINQAGSHHRRIRIKKVVTDRFHPERRSEGVTFQCLPRGQRRGAEEVDVPPGKVSSQPTKPDDCLFALPPHTDEFNFTPGKLSKEIRRGTELDRPTFGICNQVFEKFSIRFRIFDAVRSLRPVRSLIWVNVHEALRSSESTDIACHHGDPVAHTNGFGVPAATQGLGGVTIDTDNLAHPSQRHGVAPHPTTQIPDDPLKPLGLVRSDRLAGSLFQPHAIKPHLASPPETGRRPGPSITQLERGPHQIRIESLPQTILQAQLPITAVFQHVEELRSCTKAEPTVPVGNRTTHRVAPLREPQIAKGGHST